MKIDTLVIVGVGLIGGSIGLAAKQRGVAHRVIGVGRASTALEEARAVGAIDEGSQEGKSAVREAEVVVVCTPVDDIPCQVRTLAPECPAGCLITDAGSTKAAIVHALEGQLPAGIAFVGSHPLAGSEKRGARYADANLFRGRLTVVTPTASTDAGMVERCTAFWQALGSRVRLMAPAEHDRALALTSHLPHLAASAVAGILPPGLNELTATGFRDTTRVAAGDPSVWTGIFEQNREAMLDAIGLLQDRLIEFKMALMTGDRAALDELLAQGKRIRDALGS
jgi:prephenate dehydrogenase